METIIKAIEIDRTSNTLLEFFQKLEHVQKLVQNVPEIPHKMSIKSGTELLKLATTRMALDIIQEESDINKVKETLINRWAPFFIFRDIPTGSLFDVLGAMNV